MRRQGAAENADRTGPDEVTILTTTRNAHSTLRFACAVAEEARRSQSASVIRSRAVMSDEAAILSAGPNESAEDFNQHFRELIGTTQYRETHPAEDSRRIARRLSIDGQTEHVDVL